MWRCELVLNVSVQSVVDVQPSCLTLPCTIWQLLLHRLTNIHNSSTQVPLRYYSCLSVLHISTPCKCLAVILYVFVCKEHVWRAKNMYDVQSSPKWQIRFHFTDIGSKWTTSWIPRISLFPLQDTVLMWRSSGRTNEICGDQKSTGDRKTVFQQTSRDDISAMEQRSKV